MTNRQLARRLTAIGIVDHALNITEKGYVNDPSDSGGETNHGITKKVAYSYKRYWNRFGFDGDMRNLTKEFAYFIYMDGYWHTSKLDEIIQRSKLLADKMFDISINIGPSAAPKWLQEQLNLYNRRGKYWDDLTVDGAIGPASLKAFDAFIAMRGSAGIRTLVYGMICKQGNHYSDLAARREKDEEFYFGWMDRRVAQFIDFYEKCFDRGIV
jgi:lysozyme family protein